MLLKVKIFLPKFIQNFLCFMPFLYIKFQNIGGKKKNKDNCIHKASPQQKISMHVKTIYKYLKIDGSHITHFLWERNTFINHMIQFLHVHISF